MIGKNIILQIKYYELEGLSESEIDELMEDLDYPGVVMGWNGIEWERYYVDYEIEVRFTGDRVIFVDEDLAYQFMKSVVLDLPVGFILLPDNMD